MTAPVDTAFPPPLWIFHLPGGHEQASHGHGGGVAGGQAALDVIPLGLSSPGVTGRQRASFQAYTRPEHFTAINGSLRGQAAGTATSDKHISNMDNVLGRSRLTDDVETWRGVQDAGGLFGDRLKGDMTGLEWDEKGFMSTSVRKSAAQEFAQTGARAVLMRVHTRKGTGAVKLGDHERDGEGEVIIRRGVKARVVKDHGVDPNWGYRILDIEVT